MKRKILTLVLALIGTMSLTAQTGTVIDKIVAVVGDETILLSDVETMGLQMSQGRRPNDVIRCGAMEQLLFQKLLINQGKIDSIEVSEVEVDTKIDLQMNSIIAQLGGEDEFTAYYGKTPGEYKEILRDDYRERILVDKAQMQITQDVKVTPGEIHDLFNSIPKDSLPLIGEQIEFRKLVIDTEVTDDQKLRTREMLDSIRTLLVNGESSMLIQA
ncbi:MAG: hypothetical protein HKN32_10465, partial [Flavobacteriales bacterium]|nr:hypothetical protein [Flavobacteriales bacterium]